MSSAACRRMGVTWGHMGSHGSWPWGHMGSHGPWPWGHAGSRCLACRLSSSNSAPRATRGATLGGTASLWSRIRIHHDPVTSHTSSGICQHRGRGWAKYGTQGGE
eukprot:5024254-Prymnesium_polylepis.1